MPAIALIVSVIASVVIGGAGSLAFPPPALIWCAVRYTPQVTCLLTFVTGAVEVVLVANSVIDISVGSPFSIPQMFSRTSRYCHDGDMPNYGFLLAWQRSIR